MFLVLCRTIEALLQVLPKTKIHPYTDGLSACSDRGEDRAVKDLSGGQIQRGASRRMAFEPDAV